MSLQSDWPSTCHTARPGNQSAIPPVLSPGLPISQTWSISTSARHSGRPIPLTSPVLPCPTPNASPENGADGKYFQSMIVSTLWSYSDYLANISDRLSEQSMVGRMVAVKMPSKRPHVAPAAVLGFLSPITPTSPLHVYWCRQVNQERSGSLNITSMRQLLSSLAIVIYSRPALVCMLEVTCTTLVGVCKDQWITCKHSALSPHMFSFKHIQVCVQSHWSLSPPLDLLGYITSNILFPPFWPIALFPISTGLLPLFNMA